MSFSLWCDFIENSFLDNEFLELLKFGVNGATSNPAIFKNAILNSHIYKDKIAKLKGKKAKEIYEILAIEDIQKAADKLAPLFFAKNDGFISLEIDPRLWDNTSLSIGEAKRLYTTIGKENVMMKIPATKASYEVMFELMKSGINVNATLIFSLEQAKNCFNALNEGLKAFRIQNTTKTTPKAVISVFVSRFDRLLNSKLSEKNTLGILTSSLAYKYIYNQNEPNIRTLFASTGVKGDDLPKDFYIKELLFENSINTAPLDAINAFKGKEINLKKPLSSSKIHKRISNLNLSQEELEQACKLLLDDGLNQFCIAFEEILKAL